MRKTKGKRKKGKLYRPSKKLKSSCERGPELPLDGGGGAVLIALRGEALVDADGEIGERVFEEARGGGEVDTGLEIG